MTTTLPRPRPVRAPSEVAYEPPIKLEVRDLSVWYGSTQALHGVSLDVPERSVLALIGASGSGKSTLLRAMNRIHELTPGTRTEGDVRLDGQSVYGAADPVLVRRHIGMVFQAPNPFPKTIYENVAWGARINGLDGDMDDRVEEALEQAALFSEVKDRLHTSAYGLSGGQQQRLCIARALAVEPALLLMDEPTSALDPRASALIEETVRTLADRYTVVIVTHNMQQARRVSDRTAFMDAGRLVEVGETPQVFEAPREERTRAYVSGQFG
ncbi:phosphate ABC transporter ATP-binding protein PstB [Rubrivirga marina]|uniref:phosphate ABC transporter ATP-binding protein PstB n=1 Tax=Rubrivirga marina TaxID=1196024 RepID=UPI000BA8E349|nr:phosphate ABC transporter ATP-binding protein PstB [Rubrivirga marina]